ncbi:uncharacterized protein LAJ45_08452 [Morchella importuna]|uniref:uncharacterized protein n=1 Tax=Morchella importuna TaxID=1174673 RepID=UPI001E8EB2E7|nr:uncharacterized protein LAJ45_08452 [Morchella importuna]KAH8147624.1 hypothetical protein LAJ45_08452 [Morchella importuna]
MFSNTPKTPSAPPPPPLLVQQSPAHPSARSPPSTTTTGPPPAAPPPPPSPQRPERRKTLNSLGKMRYRWNDPNLGARYRGVDKDLGVKGSTADYAYPVLQMGSEPARGVVRRRREGSGQGQGL